MPKQTNADLLARIAELEAQNAQLSRAKVTCSLFPNPSDNPRAPVETGPCRLTLIDGHVVWCDISRWNADPERFDSDTPPSSRLQLKVMLPQYADKAEAEYQDYLARRDGS